MNEVNDLSRQNDKAVRNILAGLLGGQLLVLAWYIVAKSHSGGTAGPDLNLLVFIGACSNMILVGRLVLGKYFRTLLRSLWVLCAGSAVVSAVSFACVDYRALLNANLGLAAVFLFIAFASHARKRR